MPPSIDLFNLPQKEHEAAWLISVQFFNLDSFVKDFETAVDLFAETSVNPRSTVQIEKPLKFSQKDDLITRIRKMRDHSEKRKAEFLALQDEAEHLNYRARTHMMAARDGAMTIFHIAKSLQTININLKLCPSVASQVDKVILRAGCKKFSTSFPHAETLRNAVAHVAEFTQNPEHFQKIAARIGGLSLNNLNGDEFTTTSLKGKHVSYRINKQTASIIRQSIQEVFSAFA